MAPFFDCTRSCRQGLITSDVNLSLFFFLSFSKSKLLSLTKKSLSDFTAESVFSIHVHTIYRKLNYEKVREVLCLKSALCYGEFKYDITQGFEVQPEFNLRDQYTVQCLNYISRGARVMYIRSTTDRLSLCYTENRLFTILKLL